MMIDLKNKRDGVFSSVKNRERCFFVLSRTWDKENILSPLEQSIPHGDSEFSMIS